jgi:hypothetical protein
MNIKPTVGRVLWYYPQSNEPMVRHDNQPCMALLCWPNGTTAVNLLVIDHFGNVFPVMDAELVQEGDAVPGAGGYAAWMPYQVGQAKKHAGEDVALGGGGVGVGSAADTEAKAKTIYDERSRIDANYGVGYRDGYRQATFDAETMGLDAFLVQAKIGPEDAETVEQRGYKAGFQDAEKMHFAKSLDLPGQEARQRRAAGLSFWISGCDFGCALEAAKQGKKISRPGWNARRNGLDQFVVRMPSLKLPPYSTQAPGPKVNDRTAKWIGVDTPLDCQPYYAMFIEGAWQPGWLPSQADLEAGDWEIYPVEELPAATE